jgi:TRAP-type uncharacterized transport system fused permease subunit
VQAAASSGGALMPPVMGAAAYMMLEIVDPPVTYLEIIRAALPAGAAVLPVALPVRALLRAAVDDRSRWSCPPAAEGRGAAVGRLEGLIFFGALAVLMVLLAPATRRSARSRSRSA